MGKWHDCIKSFVLWFVSVAVTADSGAARGNQYPQWAEVGGLTRQAFQTECRYTKNYFLICMFIQSESTIIKLCFSKTMQEANSWEFCALHSTNVANFTQISKIHHPQVHCHHHYEHCTLVPPLLYHSPSYKWIWKWAQCSHSRLIEAVLVDSWVRAEIMQAMLKHVNMQS